MVLSCGNENKKPITLILVPCFLARLLVVSERGIHDGSLLFERIRSICFSLSCSTVDDHVLASKDEITAARLTLATLALYGSSTSALTILESMRGQCTAAENASQDMDSAQNCIEVAITEGWILRALWARQSSANGLTTSDSAFAAVLDLVCGKARRSAPPFISCLTLSLIVGPFSSILVRMH